MAFTTAQKLKIKQGDQICLINEPVSYAKSLGKLSADISFVARIADAQQVHCFVENRAQLEKEFPRVLKQMKAGTILWFFYPKGSSGIQTDLTRDIGWEIFLQQDQLQWLTLISFDTTWSAFACRLKSEADKKKEAKPVEREIFKWVDPQKKTVRLPDELKTAFKNNKTAATYFDSLAYSHRREYVEWIVTAKKVETRQKRVAGTIEMLNKKRKNPADK
jgi:Bacteriocin-protection, YdeI or OmpD-Associated